MNGENETTLTADESGSISLSRRSVLGATGAVAVSGLLAGLGGARTADELDFIDATALEIREGYERGEFTAKAVVEYYLDRIHEYEDALQAVISINPNALERAAELDAALGVEDSPSNPGGGPPSHAEGNPPAHAGGGSPSGELVGPLHGIPVLVKDNVNTDDMPTTSGTVAMADSIPAESATIVEQIREAGGIVIAKANMDEFAFGYSSSSSLGGTVYNPYDLERTAGGSSGGTGAGIGANYAPLGIGTDTGGSVRVPSLANNLVGLRPTRQLVSGDGVSPLHSSQDVPGPMTTTVEDAALLTDVLAGVDPDDPLTLEADGKTPHAAGGQYTDYLNEDGLEGKRIGVYSDWMPDEDEADIAALFGEAISDIASAGATVVSGLEPPSGSFVSDAYRGNHTHMDWNDYLEGIAEFDDLEELAASGELESCGITSSLELSDDVDELAEDLDFVQPFYEQRDLQHYVLRQVHENDLDAIAYPGNWDVPPAEGRGSWGPANLHLSPVLDWPSIVLPVGFTDDGAPVGMEFLGRMWSEPTLFEIAYAFEQVSDNREPPADFGPVDGTDVDWDADAIEAWNDERPVYNTVEGCGVSGVRATNADRPGTEGVDTSNLPADR
ncbi:amidase [Natronolimnohabitans innermongolicus]|uniref:Amidase n=1 Tax=Natronolimnohabitans innermongolicus JCM 12255 TaxID=1227499 RepID=L9XB36_9EURY|nr:amidase [Natronolimnohabitans innermongolicus]ELY58636.1 amidase [Natronolimnohabitans innermongolicus JCM 12255]